MPALQNLSGHPNLDPDALCKLDLSLAFFEFCDSALDHGLHGIQAGSFGTDGVQ